MYYRRCFELSGNTKEFSLYAIRPHSLRPPLWISASVYRATVALLHSSQDTSSGGFCCGTPKNCRLLARLEFARAGNKGTELVLIPRSGDQFQIHRVLL